MFNASRHTPHVIILIFDFYVNLIFAMWDVVVVPRSLEGIILSFTRILHYVMQYIYFPGLTKSQDNGKSQDNNREIECMRWDRIRSQKYGLVPICPKKNARPYVCCTVSLVFSLWDRLKNIRSNNTYRLSYAYWIPLKSLFWGNKLSIFC